MGGYARGASMLRRVTAMARMHPRIPMAIKAAFAAAIAWLVIQPFGGPADDYPYYGPLGAVIAVSTTVAGSIRVSLQGLGAILLGALLAMGAAKLPWDGVVELALLVAIGTLLAGWRGFGSMGSWVPISAVFVLIIGRSDGLDFVIGYLGLTTVGSLIGIAVNVAFPPLPLALADGKVTELREVLARQLHDLAEGLLTENVLSKEDWDERQHAILPRTREMRRLVSEATEARRINWRAHRWRRVADRQYEHARTLVRLSLLVDDITALVVAGHGLGEPTFAVSRNLRRPSARALRAMAALLSSMHGGVVDRAKLEQAEQTARDLSTAIEDVGAYGDEVYGSATIVTAIRRGIASLEPDALSRNLPAPD